VVILPTKTTPTTTTTTERTTAYYKYDNYHSYDYSSHHNKKEEPSAESQKVEKAEALDRLKLSEHVVLLPTTPATTTTKLESSKETTKYQHKRYTYATESPKTKPALNGLHLSENIVVLPTTTTTTTTTTAEDSPACILPNISSHSFKRRLSPLNLYVTSWPFSIKR